MGPSQPWRPICRLLGGGGLKNRIAPGTQALRRRAEAIAEDYQAELSRGDQALTPVQAQKVLHELRVHQIELEMQNEELRRTQHELDIERKRYFDLYDLAPVGYLSVSEQGLILEANLSAAILLGEARRHLVQQPISTFIARDDQDAYYLLRRRLVDTHKTQTCELQMKPKDVQPLWVHLTVSLTQEGDAASEFHIVINDISERKKVEKALSESEFRWRFAIEGTGDGLWDWDVAQSTVLFSKRWKEMLGFSQDEIGNGLDEWSKRVHPDDLARVMVDVQAHLDGATADYVNEHRVSCKDGSWKWILDRGLVVNRDPAGKPLRIIGTHTDITERRNAHATLQLAANVFNHAREGVTITDANGSIIDVNAAFTRITGYSREEVLGQNPRILQSGRQTKEFYVAMWGDLLASGHWSGEVWNKRKNGEIYPELLTISAVIDAQGSVSQYVGLFTDITARRQMEDKVHQMAFFDPLTRLPNRRTLSDRLGQTMASSKRSGHYGALMVLDLDNFKPLNDTHGHGAGDLLLEAVAGRMTACVREVDTVARIGGDEFVVLLSELDTDQGESMAQAGLIAEKIRLALAAPYSLPVSRQGQAASAVEHCCSASIGVVLFLDHEASEEDILRWADAAMYQAKAAGRNAIRFHGPDGVT